MCGRFYTDDDDAQYRQVIALLYQRNPADTALLLRKSGEIFPTDKVPVLDAQGPRLMEWGFSRFDGKGRVINARSETVLEKTMFRAPMQSGRCLIPASGYFEWETREAKKLKYSLRPRGEGMFYFAGLWRPESQSTLPLFVILIAPAANQISFIHERMPLMLGESQKARWLGDAADAARLLNEGLRDVAYERCG
jgi:putative SOS response-associated peptidase YedK